MTKGDIPVLSCEQAKIRLGPAIEIGPVSTTVTRGSVLALIGSNGAGKTTLLRMICGLVAADSGSIKVNGEDVRGGWPTSGVGGLIEEPGFLPWMSGRDNLLYAAAGRPQFLDRVELCLEKVALSARADDKVRHYSQGMRQRLGVARVLLSEPSLLVLDEPTNGLDPEGLSVIRKLLADHAATGGAAIVSSHALGELTRISDEVLVMGGGSVVGQGALRDVCRPGESLEDVYFRLGT